jgi:hypothetical protein
MCSTCKPHACAASNPTANGGGGQVGRLPKVALTPSHDHLQAPRGGQTSRGRSPSRAATSSAIPPAAGRGCSHGPRGGARGRGLSCVCACVACTEGLSDCCAVAQPRAGSTSSTRNPVPALRKGRGLDGKRGCCATVALLERSSITPSSTQGPPSRPNPAHPPLPRPPPSLSCGAHLSRAARS